MTEAFGETAFELHAKVLNRCPNSFDGLRIVRVTQQTKG